MSFTKCVVSIFFFFLTQVRPKILFKGMGDQKCFKWELKNFEWESSSFLCFCRLIVAKFRLIVAV